MSGLVRGVALLTALVLCANGALGQNRASDNSFYDTGGYLERPYAVDDSDQSPGETTEAPRRQRKPRPDSPDGLTQVPQIRPGQQGAGGNAAAPRSNAAPRGASEGYRPASQAEPQQQTRGAEVSSISDMTIPPLPLRRPRFPDAPRPAVAALSSSEPAVMEAAPARQPVKTEETPPAEAQEAPISLNNAVVETPASAETPPSPAADTTGGSESARQETPEPTLAEAPAEETPAPAASAALAQEGPAQPQPAADAAAAAPVPASEPATAAAPETPVLPAPVAATAPPAAEPAPVPAAQASAAPAIPAPAETNELASAPAQPEKPAVDPAVLAELSPAGNPTVSAHPKGQASENADAAPAPETPAAPEPVAAASPAPPVTARPSEPVPAAMEQALATPPARQVVANLATDAAQQAPTPPNRSAVSLDKIIGQMLMVGFRGLTPEDSWPQRLAAQIKAGTVGGVLVMSHNVQSPQQIKALTGFFQRAKGDIPLIIAVDQEGGIVQRLSPEKGFQEYPTAGKIGKSNDPLTAYSVYRRLAGELSQHGFNLNLGPVVDLLRNDASPIIAGKERSFGPMPKHVAAFAKAFIVAHQDEGVLTTLKHFPGHGSTAFDTHVQPVDVGSSWEEAEIEPYRDLIASKSVQAIMVGHIAHPGMAEEVGMPASLSGKAIRKVLRGDLGYSGVVISDDLEMGAIRERYSIAESAVKAIKAGNDIIILSNQNTPNPDLPDRVAAAIKKAVETGVLKRAELEASYDRILGLKQRLQGGAAVKAASPNKRASAERGKTAPAR